MTKKGFTLMELLVSIFISGMVMLSLVAMWKTSSNQTAEAQRQSIIKNENTIFLRKIYSDFVSATEIICPKGHDSINYTCDDSFIAMKGAIVKDDGSLIPITQPVCGENNDSWATDEEDIDAMAARCIKPSYTIYIHNNNKIYRCVYNDFLDGDGDDFNNINQIVTGAGTRCKDSEDKELIMPYVTSFSLRSDGSSTLKVDYTVNREFSNDIPPVYFKFKKYFARKRGV